LFAHYGLLLASVWMRRTCSATYCFVWSLVLFAEGEFGQTVSHQHAGCGIWLILFVPWWIWVVVLTILNMIVLSLSFLFLFIFRLHC